MKIQLALDRFSIEKAISIANEARPYVDWIEVGTSLIKEFGVQSIIELRKAFLDKVIVADIKTFDNAEYEMNLCFDAGADVATVLGVASNVTIEKCIHVAEARGRKVMVDLASVPSGKLTEMPASDHVVWCLHVSKDEQETLHVQQSGDEVSVLQLPVRPELAIAGGITLESVSGLARLMPDVVIVGSYITKAADPKNAARRMKESLTQLEMEQQ